MPVFTSSIEVTADYPTIKPSLNLNFARSRSLDPRITFTRASTATYIGRDGLVKYAGEDEARFDHDPVTLESLGLLIEESRINLLANSGQISLTQSWAVAVSANQTVTPNAVIAPDGTITGTQFTTNTPTGSNIQWIYQNVSGNYSNVAVTGSFWARADATRTLSAHITDNVSGTTYNYTVTTEWQRFSFTKICNAGSGGTGLYPIFITNEPAGLNVYLWGGQLEVGSFPTSYIPTSGSAVTRAADEGNITGDAFSSFYNTTEGVLQTEFSRIGSVNNQMVVQFKDSDGSERIEIRGQGGSDDSFRMEVIEGGATGAQEYQFSSGAVVANVVGQFAKVNLAYKQNDFASTINGTLASIDNAGDVGVCDRVGIGYANYGIGYNGHIKNIIYYPKRLTNTQLQLLTS